jgi:hypothetical protein
MGWDDWLINTTLQLFDLYRKAYASSTETNTLFTVCQGLRSGFQIASWIWHPGESFWVRIQRWPTGFIVTGDGVCAFNPIYGQGMTVSALDPMTLQR